MEVRWFLEEGGGADKQCRKSSRYGKYHNPEKFCNDNGFFRPVVNPSLKSELEAKVGKKPLMLTL
jgi:hypothetical protein